MPATMSLQDIPQSEEDELKWPSTPSAILIMGKRKRGRSGEHKQLQGRVAMAAALWHSAPDPKPYMVFVAADVHGADKTPDGELVRSLLLQRFDIPADYLILRFHSNCTIIEVRAIRAIARSYNLTHVFLLTHLYHAARTQKYADEVLPNASVIPVHPDILNEITFPVMYEDLLPDIQNLIDVSQPSRFDSFREAVVEWILTQIHRFDSRGRLEQTLANRLRPSARKNKGTIDN